MCIGAIASNESCLEDVHCTSPVERELADDTGQVYRFLRLLWLLLVGCYRWLPRFRKSRRSTERARVYSRPLQDSSQTSPTSNDALKRCCKRLSLQTFLATTFWCAFRADAKITFLAHCCNMLGKCELQVHGGRHTETFDVSRLMNG